MSNSRRQAELGIASLIAYLGYDPNNRDLADTPDRVIRAYTELTRGNQDDPAEILSKQFAPDPGHNNDEMIVLSKIDYVAICEHHLLPFPGTAAVAYLPQPDAAVVGLSKLARLIDCYTRRLTMQERITQQVTDALDRHLETQGSACILRSRHQCMTIRGAHKSDAIMTTSSTTGKFRTNPDTRAELLNLTQP